MCEQCREHIQKEIKTIHEEMDEQGVPEDSLLRGLAEVQIVCTYQPVLSEIMPNIYPSSQTLMQ